MKKLLLFFSFLTCTTLHAQHRSGVEWEGKNWMSLLPDAALVSQLSLPGAHDAATGEGWASGIINQAGRTNSQTQDVKVEEMYANGVRVFDIRPSLYNNVLYNSHGQTRLNKTVESLLDEMVAFLNENPTEFFIFHVFKGGSDWEGEAFGKLITQDKYKNYLASFKKTLTVKDMRGKMLFLYRHDHAGTAWKGGYLRWWNEKGYDTNRDSYINANGANNYDWNYLSSAAIYVQDFSNTTPENGGVGEKLRLMRDLLDFSTGHTVSQSSQIVWSINFASAYSQTLLGVSLSDGYRDNATYTNKLILDYLTADNYVPGPTGILMMDYVCVDETKFNSNRYSTNGNKTYGKQVVEAVVDNNFRCTEQQLTLPTYTSTLPIAFSKYSSIKSGVKTSAMPAANRLMPEHRGYPIWGDFNGDGMMDFYYSGTSQCHGWTNYPSMVWNQGGGNLTYSYENNGLPVGAYGMGSTTLDYDQDGNVDFLFLNRGGNNSWHEDYFTGERTEMGELLLVRNNGDGTFQVIPDETLRNIGFKLGADMEWNNGRKATTLNVGDYDADGYPDIVLQGMNGDTRFVKVLHNKQGQGFELAQQLTPQGEGGVTFADFNADGLLDIASAGKGNSGIMELRFYRGTGNAETPFIEITKEVAEACGFASEDAFHSHWGTYETSIVALDYDQNGVIDLFFNGTGKDAWNKQSIVLINHTAPEAEAFSFRKMSSGITPICLASDRLFSLVDLNGDDYVDAIQQGWTCQARDWRYAVSYTNGSLNSYKSTLFSTDEEGNSKIGGTFQDAGTMSFGDFNGDGLLDLAAVGYTSRGENAEVFYNTTKNTTVVAPEAPQQVSAERSEDGTITISWTASQLAKTGGKPMYNLYIKNIKTDDTRMLVAAVDSTGAQKGYAAFSTYFLSPEEQPTYVLRNFPDEDYIIGVQAVSYNYAASPFTTVQILSQETLTGIAAHRSHKTDNTLYDLSGRRAAIKKGIYLQGGKKILR